MAHEIAEASRAAIQSCRQEREVTGGKVVEIPAMRIAPQLIKEIAEDEGPRIVIGAVAFVKIRHRENGMLEDASAVAHAHDMIQAQGWQIIGPAGESPPGKSRTGSHFAVLPGPLERVEIALGHGGPDHISAKPVRFPARCFHALRVI